MPLYFPVKDIWCCLAPAERGANIALLDVYFFGPGYITVDDFNTLWAVVDFDNSTARKFAYTHQYGMTVGTAIIDGEEVTVWYLTGLWWPAFLTFSVVTGLPCSSLCKYITFPE